MTVIHPRKRSRMKSDSTQVMQREALTREQVLRNNKKDPKASK